MMLALLVNGVALDDPARAIAADDRAFNYGDGVFETGLVLKGRVRYLDAHLERLFSGCARLGIVAPERSILVEEIGRLTALAVSAVVKIVISRGSGGRGYRPATGAATRVLMLYPPPPATTHALRLRWCGMRLGRNARLAGIKHLNRLEQVLAQSEWSSDEADEGLMMDTEGELVCATAGNVFVVRDGTLMTPDLRFCGVRGIMRAQVLKAAAQLGIPASEEPLWPHDLQAATEVFVTNAVRGIRPAGSLETQQWSASPVAHRLARTLGL